MPSAMHGAPTPQIKRKAAPVVVRPAGGSPASTVEVTPADADGTVGVRMGGAWGALVAQKHELEALLTDVTTARDLARAAATSHAATNERLQAQLEAHAAALASAEAAAGAAAAQLLESRAEAALLRNQTAVMQVMVVVVRVWVGC
jgi:hypothetical protein